MTTVRREIVLYGTLVLAHLVYELSPEWVILQEYLSPQLLIPSSHQVAGLALEQGVLVAHVDELPVALSSLVSHAGQVRVALLAVLANDTAIIELVFSAGEIRH